MCWDNFYGVKPQKLKTLSGIDTPSLLTELLQTVTQNLKPYQGLKPSTLDSVWFVLISAFLTKKTSRHSVSGCRKRSPAATNRNSVSIKQGYNTYSIVQKMGRLKMFYAATGCKREQYLQKFRVESCFGRPFGRWQGTKSLISPH